MFPDINNPGCNRAHGQIGGAAALPPAGAAQRDVEAQLTRLAETAGYLAQAVQELSERLAPVLYPELAQGSTADNAPTPGASAATALAQVISDQTERVHLSLRHLHSLQRRLGI